MALRLEDFSPLVQELIKAEREKLAAGPQSEAKVVATGGTKAERQLRAAYHDLESLDYARSGNEEALAHHNEQRQIIAGQEATAKIVFAEREAAVAAERSQGAPEGGG